MRLPWRYKLTTIHVVVRVVLVRLGLWALPYATVRRMIDRASRPRAVRVADVPAYRKRVLQCVAAVANRLLGSKPCLTQALVAQWLLGQTGFSTDLKFGVATGEKGLEAHAWLEKNGQVILGGHTSPFRYATLHPVSS